MKNTFILYGITLIILFIRAYSISAQNIPDFQVNEQTGLDGSEQESPNLDGDGKGNYIVTWRDNRNGTDDNIFAQIFLNDSTPLSNNFIVNDDAGTAPQYGPDVAVDPNLNFVITWLDRRDGFVWDIYAQRYSSSGTPLGSNFKVNEEPDNEEQVGATVSIDSCGNFVIVWADEKNGDYDYDIYGQLYLTDGTILGDNFKINDDLGNESQYWPTCELAKNGDFVVAWGDKRYNDNFDIYAQLYLANGTAIGDNFKVNVDNGLIMQLRPDITIMENGDFIITWEDKRNGNWDIYAQCYQNDGVTIGGNFKINDDTPNTDQRNTSVTTDLAGNFTVCWQDDRNEYQDIYAQRFSNVATPIGDNFLVNIDTVDVYQNNAKISADEDGNLLIIWEDHRFGFNGDIFAQHYLNNGTATGDNYKVNDDTSDGNQTGPSIAKVSNDNFIIAWFDSRNYSFDIHAQRFSSDGIAFGNTIIVNDEDQNYANHGGPSISADNAGNFVVAWDDFRYEYWGEIYAQRFSSDGTPLDSNFKVNTLVYNVVYGATVACQNNGDFIIVWGDSEDGGKYPKQSPNFNEYENLSDKVGTDKLNSQPDVWAQLYLSDGSPVGDNFIVNDDENDSEQTNPVIAVDSIGNFIIAWNDNRDGDWGIYIQRYLSNGTAIDSNIKIIDSLIITYPTWPSLSIDNEGNFIIIWVDKQNANSDLWGQQFSNNCLPVGDIFLVNDDTTNALQTDPCVSIDDNGNFIVSWFDRRNDDHDVYAQKYLNGGIPLGSNYRVSNTGDMYQMRPSVILDNDRIFSTWQDNRGGQSGYDIWANVLNWDSWVEIDDNVQMETIPKYSLSQNYPNPFYSSTQITYSIIEDSFVNLTIYDLQGREIKSLVDEFQNANNYSIQLDDSKLESGIYFYQLNAGKKFSETKKMILMR